MQLGYINFSQEEKNNLYKVIQSIRDHHAIDELGMLALQTRIEDRQTSDHIVTVAEVRELVDEAIANANRKNLQHFFDLILGKRYDEEDMVILREKDFM